MIISQLRKIFVLLLVSVIVLFNSCKPEFPSWEVEGVFPLIHTRLTLADVDTDSLIQTDTSGLLRLYYEYVFTDFNLDSLTTDMDTIASYAYVSPFSILMAPGSQVFTKTEVSRLGVKGVYFSTLHIRDGKLKIKAVNKYTQPIIIQYSIPSATINGQEFEIYRELPSAPSLTQPYIHEEYIDIDGLHWDFFSLGQDQYNCYDAELNIWISPNATQSVQITAGDQFVFYVGFDEVDIGYARGYFGKHDVDLNEQFDFEVFQKLSADQLLLDSALLSLEVTNNIGFDLQMKLIKMIGENIHSSNSIAYTGPYLNVPLNIVRASEIAPGQGLKPANTYVYDLAEQSNIISFIENMPGKINIEAALSVNPLGNVSGGNDFYYGEPLVGKMVFSMPLHFSITNLVLSDTSDFETDFLNENIQHLQLKCVALNSFPLEMNLQLAFLDSNNNLLETVPFSSPLFAADLGVDGKTTGARQSVIFIDLSQLELDRIRPAKRISVIAGVSSLPYGTLVKMYADYFVDIKVVAQLRYLLNSKE